MRVYLVIHSFLFRVSSSSFVASVVQGYSNNDDFGKEVVGEVKRKIEWPKEAWILGQDVSPGCCRLFCGYDRALGYSCLLEFMAWDLWSSSYAQGFSESHSFPKSPRGLTRIRLKPACQSSFQRDYSDLNSRYNSNRIWYKKE
ncbi:hypothetical protein JHK85_025654 [Glycine max]|nr:hypothetical protein JHK85_025654 [Glycine max]KAG5012897.1 hypothetical protein JHK86_025158 [Glycine max]